MSLNDISDLSVLEDSESSLDIPLPSGQREQSQEMMPYNPFMVRPNMTWDQETMNRMISIRRPTVVSGEIWLTEAKFAETLSLLPLNKAEQKAYWRKFRKIQMQHPGELNKKIIDSRQERLMFELISQKSRLDVAPNGNLNERLAWISSIAKQELNQSLHTPPPSQPKGFFGSLVGGLTGKR